MFERFFSHFLDLDQFDPFRTVVREFEAAVLAICIFACSPVFRCGVRRSTLAVSPPARGVFLLRLGETKAKPVCEA